MNKNVARPRVLLVDAVQGVAVGKALDIRQSGAVEGFHTTLDGTSDESPGVPSHAFEQSHDWMKVTA